MFSDAQAKLKLDIKLNRIRGLFITALFLLKAHLPKLGYDLQGGLIGFYRIAGLETNIFFVS